MDAKDTAKAIMRHDDFKIDQMEQIECECFGWNTTFVRSRVFHCRMCSTCSDSIYDDISEVTSNEMGTSHGCRGLNQSCNTPGMSQEIFYVYCIPMSHQYPLFNLMAPPLLAATCLCLLSNHAHIPYSFHMCIQLYMYLTKIPFTSCKKLSDWKLIFTSQNHTHPLAA